MVQVNRVCLKILFINRPQFLVDSNETDLLETHNEIPWLAIYDMRNIISHECSHVDEEVIYSTIKDDLPPLKNVIEQILNNI